MVKYAMVIGMCVVACLRATFQALLRVGRVNGDLTCYMYSMDSALTPHNYWY